MRKRSPIIWMLFFILSGSTAFAGHWTGGGEIYGDAQNPWFMQNTKKVRYCIEIDRGAFAQEPDTLSKRVKLALDWWKTELAGSLAPENRNSIIIKLGTQEFVEVACDETVDLRFQFGVLSQEQRQKVGNTQHIIGFTYRDSYDEIQLRGKGYIYIGSSVGPLAFEVPRGASPDPWNLCDGCLLDRALLHEIGHVFGVPHGGDRDSLMGLDHLESILSKVGAAQVIAKQNTFRFFRFGRNRSLMYCRKLPFKDQVAAYFNLRQEPGCVRFDFKTEGVNIGWTNELSCSAPISQLGTFTYQARDSDARFFNGVSIRLPNKQIVFPKASGLSALSGPSPVLEQGVGTFRKSIDSSESPVSLIFEPMRMQFNIVDNGKMVLDIFQPYSPIECK